MNFKQRFVTLNNLLLLGICIGVVLLLFAFIDADYSPLRRWGDCADEGFWVHNARMKVLYGTYTHDQLNQAYMGAPLFNVVSYAVFKYACISLTTARIPSVICFILTCVSLFFIIKKNNSTRTSLAYVILTATCHELIMYCTWATPLFFEILFYTLILLVYTYKERINTYVQGFLIALFMLAAITAKLTSIYFLVPLALFLGIEFFIKKTIEFKFIGAFALSGVTLLGLLILLFYLPNSTAFLFFYNSIATTNVHNNVSFILRQLIIAPINLSAFMYPSIAVVFMLVVFRGITLLQHYHFSFKQLILQLHTTELYGWCWIIGSCVALACTGELGYDRRMVHLIIPLSIIAFYYIKNCFVAVNYTSLLVHKNKTVQLFFKAIVLLVLIGYSSFYLIATVRYRMWFAQLGISKSVMVYVFIIAFCVVLCYAFVVVINRKIVAYVSIIYLVTVNVILNSIWIMNRTYTIKNINQHIETMGTTATYITGPCAHLVSINNSALIPLWYRTENMGKMPINAWFKSYISTHPFLWIEMDYCAGNKNEFVSNTSSDYYFYLNKQALNNKQLLPLMPIKLCNYAGAKPHRMLGVVYEVR
jgi:hypothetical protein